MKIIRIIDNQPVEITLSRREMCEAFWEQQVNFDMDSVMNCLDIAAGDGDSEAEVMWNNLTNCPELRKRVAYRYKKFLEDTQTFEKELGCIKDAYTYVCKNIDC